MSRKQPHNDIVLFSKMDIYRQQFIISAINPLVNRPVVSFFKSPLGISIFIQSLIVCGAVISSVYFISDYFYKKLKPVRGPESGTIPQEEKPRENCADDFSEIKLYIKKTD